MSTIIKQHGGAIIMVALSLITIGALAETLKVLSIL